MRILYLNDVPGDLGGGEYQLLHLAAGAKAAGFEPFVGCIAGSLLETAVRAAGIEVFDLSELRRNPVAAALAVRRLCRRLDIDVVHTGSFLTNFAGRLGARGTGAKVVTTVHCEPDSYKLAAPGIKRRIVYAARDLVERLTFRHTDDFIAVSTAVAAKLIDRGLAAEKITVIPNGIDIEGVRRAAGRPAPVLSTGRLSLGAMGRLDPVKGLDVFIKAVELLVGQGAAVQATIIGDGPNGPPLKALAAGLGVGDIVEFPGYLADPYPVVAGFDVYIVSSRSEGQNITILEAMALDVPVVATAVGGVIDMVIDGETGLLVPHDDPVALAEAVNRLANDRQLRDRIVHGARGRLEQFTAREMCSTTMEIYKGLQ